MPDSALHPPAGLALREDELRRIAQTLGREPTLVELYAFDAQWSEHCSYKSSRRHLRKLPTESPDVVLGPGEDAGIVRLGEHAGEQYCIVAAHESHNHPSQVVPFEGAATGVGGIVRDVVCMGAEVVAVADSLRFGSVSDPDSHQRYVAQGSVDGISAYGNALGIPNVAGDVHFDAGFNENCLVNVIALGVVKEKEIIHSAAPENAAGWDIVLVGKATDASGFGGASFASLSLDAEDAEANKGAVQVPDPFLENVIMRASYRVFAFLRERGITVGFKDLGAGGIMGCTAELCGSGGFGAIIDLDDVNAASDDLPSHVIAVGETQERLCWVLPGEITGDVLRIYNEEFSLPEIARGARACVIGAVQQEQRYVMRRGNDIVMDVPIDFLIGSIHDDLPYNAERASSHPERSAERAVEGQPNESEAFQDLKQTLSSHNVASTEPLYKRYDSVVRGTTVLGRGAADAGIIAPIEGSRLGIALSVAGVPAKGGLDAGSAAALSVREAVRKVVAVGARPVALTDCLNFGNPHKIEQYSDFVHAIDGLAAAAREFGVPFVSGNVSLYNESHAGAIPGSAIVACIGVLEDVSKAVTPGLKREGSPLFFVRGDPEAVGALRKAVEHGMVLACASINAAGPFVTAARMAFDAIDSGRSLGLVLDNVAKHSIVKEGFLVEVSGDEQFAALIGPHGTRAASVAARTELATDEYRFALAELKSAWQNGLREVFA